MVGKPDTDSTKSVLLMVVPKGVVTATLPVMATTGMRLN